MPPPFGLYLHIPFCSAICAYCNFNRGLFDAARKDAYLGALGREIREAPGRLGADGGLLAADTIFFGGGTPSLLEPAEVAGLIETCRAAFAVSDEAEITLETNPETLTVERARDYRAAGVNRISLGVQSFRDEELVRLGRVHDAARAEGAFESARSAGFDNISLDLIMWLPEQTVEQWMVSIERLIELGPEHASLYLLELYPNAPLREDMARAHWSLAPDDDAAEMYLSAMARLEAAGYEQYEISNVARPGRQSRHNLKYWTDGEWVGFGCGAHSTVAGERWKNVSSVDDYTRLVGAGAPLREDVRRMTMRERAEEAIFTGLRLERGLDLGWCADRYGVDVWREYGTELQPYLDAGLLTHDAGRLRLTRPGMLLANEVMTVFV